MSNITHFENHRDVVLFNAGPTATVNYIPVGTYTLQESPDVYQSFYLKKIDNFTLPKKIYGNNSDYSDVIIRRFLKETTRLTTACLSGLKGSGKTLTAKQIAIKLAALNIPTILINSSFNGHSLGQLFQKINQPVCLFFDEFEKTYNDTDDRNSLLSFLDGTYASQKLVLLTMNANLKDSEFEFFYNRPGRVHYAIEYETLPEVVAKEFIEDCLKVKERKAEILRSLTRFKDFTLDMLNVLVEEVNENPSKSLEDLFKILNLKPDINSSELEFNVKLINTATLLEYEPTCIQPIFDPLTKIGYKIDYAFAENFLVGGSGYITLYKQFLSEDDVQEYLKLYKECVGFDEQFDFQEHLSLDEPTAEDLKLYNNFKTRFTHEFRFRVSLTNNFIENVTQNEETRAVSFDIPFLNLHVVLSVASLKPKEFKFKF